MSKHLAKKKPAAGTRRSKPPPSWFVQPSSSEDEAMDDPESLDYWKDFELPAYLRDMYPAGYDFMSDVLRQKASFGSLDFDESYKKKICLEVIKIYSELEISAVYVSQHGSSKDVNDRMRKQLPGWNLLLLNAESKPKRRTKRDKINTSAKKLPAVGLSSQKSKEVVHNYDSRAFWENVSFTDKLKKDHSAGYVFLQKVIRKETSLNYFEGGDNQLLIILKDVIKLYNSLKIGKSLTTNGKLSTLSGRVIQEIPGIDLLLRQADSHIERVNREKSSQNSNICDGSEQENEHSSDNNKDQRNDDEGNEHRGVESSQYEDDHSNKNDHEEDHSDTESSIGSKSRSPGSKDSAEYEQEAVTSTLIGKKRMPNTGSATTMIEWSALSRPLTIPDLWNRQNSGTQIHRIINILSERYVRRQKNADRENYSSVKDLLFRYICDYGVCVLLSEDKEAVPTDHMPKGESSHKLPILSVAIVDMCHEVDYTGDRKKSHYALVVLLHSGVNKYLYKLLQRVMRSKTNQVTHIYFSTLTHRKDPLLMYKPKVTEKVQEQNNLLNSLQCTDHEGAVVVSTYVYEPKSLTGMTRLSDFHKLYGNSIKNVRSALLKVARKQPGWSLLERKETHLNQTTFEYISSHVIDSSECGYVTTSDGTEKKYVIPKNINLGRSDINIYGSEIGFTADYDVAFAHIANNNGDDDFPALRKTIFHRRAGMSRSVDCCLWLAVMTMLQKYDARVSKEMKLMLDDNKAKFRHMWIMRSHDKQEDSLQQVMRKSFGYCLKRRSEEYLFDAKSKGLFVCLLKEKNGRTVHAIAVEKSNSLLMYDFEDEYPFQPMIKLNNFHGLCNSKECVGLQIVAELVPPKRKYKFFPFNF